MNTIIKKKDVITINGNLGTSQLNIEKYDFSGFGAFSIQSDFASISWKNLKSTRPKGGFFISQGPYSLRSTSLEKKEFAFVHSGENRKNVIRSVEPEKALRVPEQALKVQTFLEASLKEDPSLKKGVSKKNKNNLPFICEQKLQGISRGFFVYLRIVGIGYRVFLTKDTLTFKLGFSHLYKIKIPASIKVFLPEPTLLCLYGIDKNQVTQIAAQIQQIKKPSPYKGKGIRILNSKIRIKEGKRKS